MNKKRKVTSKKLLRAAYHQAGHTVAYLLTNRPFEYVTIRPDSDTLGYIQPPYKDWSINLKSNSFYSPNEFNTFFEYSFITIAGYVTGKIYGFSYNSVAAQLDFQRLAKVTLSDLTDKLNTNYQKFMIQYAREVLQKHWSDISAIAEALYIRKSLTYDQVQKVMKERLKSKIP
jgi:ATP-dependent Zn protease